MISFVVKFRFRQSPLSILRRMSRHEATEFTPVFGGVHVSQFLVFCVVFCRYMYNVLGFFCPFSVGHSIV
jgi:hypothetical protein